MLSYWEKEVFVQNTDVLIAGAGFSGLWMAYFLKEKAPHLRITIIDKSPLPSGASTKNAGFACFGSPSELLANCQIMGEEEALYWATKRLHGIQLIAQHFEKIADYDPCGGYEVFDEGELLENSIAFLPKLNDFFQEKTGQKTTYRLESESLQQFGFQRFGFTIKNQAEGSLNPAKLHLALTQNLQAQGVLFLMGLEVQAIEHTASQIKVITPIGELSARHLCVTLNAFLPPLFPEIECKPGRGQVLITEPIPNLPFTGTFHFEEGYYYFRNVGNRVLLGGGRNLDFEGESTTEFGLTDAIQMKLEEWLKTAILPNQEVKIADRWAGIMAFDSTKQPTARLENDKLSICGRMNGMGVALAPALAEYLANEVINVLK